MTKTFINFPETNQVQDFKNIVLMYTENSENDLRDTSEGFRTFCPFCQRNKKNEKTLTVNTVSNKFLCQKCLAKGDAIGFIARLESVSNKEAADKLGGQARESYKAPNSKPTQRPKPNTFAEKNSLEVIEMVCKKWDEAHEDVGHPYLKIKGTKPCPGLRYGLDMNGNDSIVVPFRNFYGKLNTLQYINNKGKYFITGAKQEDSFFSINNIALAKKVYLAEGLATAITIWQALGKGIPVVSFGSVQRMKTVVCAIQEKRPDIEFVVCLDLGEAPIKQARKIKHMKNISFRKPDIKSNGNDFNDMVSKDGQSIDVVSKQLEREYTVPEEMNKKTANFENIILATKTNKLTATKEFQKTNLPPSSLNDIYQEEILSYLFNQKTLDSIIQNGLSANNFEPQRFTGIYQKIMSGIVTTWEQGSPITLSQVAVNSNDNSAEFYRTLKQIESLKPIPLKQLSSRLKQLNQFYSQSKLNALIANVQNNKTSINEKCNFLSNGISDIQGTVATIFPQSHYLSHIIENLLSPKSKPLASGIKSLDRLIGGGFIKGELGILTGGAGAGKSAFALQVADSVAKNGSIVVYVSVEIGAVKLTDRSLKRFSYLQNKKNPSFDIKEGLAEYEKLANNIYLRKGNHSMQVSDIKGIVLSVMQQRKNRNVLLIIDPFQRLGSGNEKIDSNETAKVGMLCSQMKEMATNLEIPILALSDTVKNYKDNKSGEGAGRGSYVIDHTADYVMHLRTSRDPLKAMYGCIPDGQAKEEDPFIELIEKKLSEVSFAEKEGSYALKGVWDKYTCLVTSKVRDGGKFSPLFVYKPAHHYFEDTELWEDILNDNDYHK